MKILIVSDAWHPQVNGVVRTYEHLLVEMEKQGHETMVLGPTDFRFRFPIPTYKEIEIVLFPYKKLRQSVEEFKPDAMHIATEGPLGWAARRYCLKKKIPFTSCYHSQFPTYFAMRLSKPFPKSFDFFHEIGVGVIRRFHNAADGTFVTTKSMSEELKNWGITTPIFPLTRGINPDIFKPGEGTLFKDLPGPVALYVGRLAIEKNLEEFLEMPWQGSKVVVGHGPEEEAYRKKYPDISFLGKKVGDDLADCYRSSDLFVFPSYTDTFGIVIIEALACGLPIAAHDVIGPKDIIIQPELGALHEDLEQACHKALETGDPVFCANHVTENYSWAKAGEQFSSKVFKSPPEHHQREG
ncbi:MAG: glycosyltransferase family 1 protein [Pseudomonadota bacterium]